MLGRLAVVIVVVALAGAVGIAPAVAQDSGADAVEVRITARKLANGKVEFALQQRQSDDTWGDRQLPRVRLFPTTAAVDRWLFSSSLTVGDAEVRITASKLANGKVEFALQQRQSDDTWGDRQLPRVRLFPTTAAVDRWLVSSSLTITVEEPPEAGVESPPPSTTPTTVATEEGVEVWGVVPWEADFLAGFNEIVNFTIVCGFYEREYGQCDDPADMDILHQIESELYQCEVDSYTHMCIGFDGVDQMIWDQEFACPENWAIDYSEVCYHPEHPFYVDLNDPWY